MECCGDRFLATLLKQELTGAEAHRQAGYVENRAAAVGVAAEFKRDLARAGGDVVSGVVRHGRVESQPRPGLVIVYCSRDLRLERYIRQRVSESRVGHGVVIKPRGESDLFARVAGPEPTARTATYAPGSSA